MEQQGFKEWDLLYDIEDDSTLFFCNHTKDDILKNPSNFRLATENEFKECPPRVFLTKEQAIDCLPEGDNIHTFLSPNKHMLLGADESREDIIKYINNDEYRVEIGGEQCRSYGHGLVLSCEDRPPIFIEANEGKLKKYDVIPKFE